MSLRKGKPEKSNLHGNHVLISTCSNHDVIAYNGALRTVGGTSASSPTFAAVISLVNDALIAKGKSPLGFLNPWIYGGGYKALTDITSGSAIGCNVSGFPAEIGWDAVTGFGTPVSPCGLENMLLYSMLTCGLQNFGKLVAAAFASKQ